MLLLIDTDRDRSTGWNGYDVIVNRLSPDGRKAIVERNVGGRWEWEKAGEAAMAVSGDKLELSIARSILGLTDDRVDIEFKWNDNMQENGNIMDFYVNGDTAPGRTLQLRLLHAVTPEDNASPINGTAGGHPPEPAVSSASPGSGTEETPLPKKNSCEKRQRIAGKACSSGLKCLFLRSGQCATRAPRLSVAGVRFGVGRMRAPRAAKPKHHLNTI